MKKNEILEKYGNCMMPNVGGWGNVKMKDVPLPFYKSFLYDSSMTEGRYVAATPLWFYTLAMNDIDPDEFKAAVPLIEKGILTINRAA